MLQPQVMVMSFFDRLHRYWSAFWPPAYHPLSAWVAQSEPISSLPIDSLPIDSLVTSPLPTNLLSSPPPNIAFPTDLTSKDLPSKDLTQDHGAGGLANSMNLPTYSVGTTHLLETVAQVEAEYPAILPSNLVSPTGDRLPVSAAESVESACCVPSANQQINLEIANHGNLPNGSSVNDINWDKSPWDSWATEVTPEFQDMITNLFLQKLSEPLILLEELEPCYLDLNTALLDNTIQAAEQYFYAEVQFELHAVIHNN